MSAYPFSIFKRADRTCYSVSFKDATGKYLRPISTGKKTEKEATDIAFAWLRDGIPQDKTELRVHDLSLKDVARKIKTEAEAETLLQELKHTRIVRSFIEQHNRCESIGVLPFAFPVHRPGVFRHSG